MTTRPASVPGAAGERAAGERATGSRRGAYLALGGAIAVGAVAFTFVKLALGELSPVALAAGRVVFSAAAYVAVVVVQPWRRRPVPPRDRWAVLACGLGGSALFHLLFSWGQLRVSVAVSSVVLACMPVLVAVLEVLFLGHRLVPAQAAGLALSVAGVAVMSAGSPAGEVSAWGLAAVAAATVVWSAVTVVTRGFGDRYDPWWLNTPGTVTGAVVMLAVLAADPRRYAAEFSGLSLSGWLLVIWLGAVSSAFVYAALARAMHDLDATRTASLSTLVTPLGVIVAWVVLAERPAWTTWLGGAVVVLGVLLVTRRGAGSAAPTPRRR